MKLEGRVGKVKLKKGGASLHLLPTPKKSYVREIIESVSENIDEDSLVVGYFVVQKDRTVRTDWSYESGITNLDLFGGAEALKLDILNNEVNDDA